MSTPKPSAPSKPLSFRPPEMLKNQTVSSELPYVAPKKNKRNRPGQRTNLVAVDETVVHVEPLDGGMVMSMLIEDVDDFIEAAKNASDASDKPVSEKPVSEKPKKPFVLDPHLTQRPFHDDRLMHLKSQLQRPSSKNR